MTYADWNAEYRIPDADEDFLEIEKYVLRTGPWLKKWFDNAELKGLSCLDLGSGSGIFSSLLARRGAHVTSMDLTEVGATLTEKTTQFFGLPTKVVRGDAEYAPFKSESFDFVYSWGVLHHTSDMESALGEVSRILKRNGKGMMMVYHKYSIVYYLHGLFWLLFRGKLFSGHNFESVQKFYTDGFYHRYLTKVQLGRKLAAVGLKVSAFHVTQYEKKILPGISISLDEELKRRFGMCLVAEFVKTQENSLK